MHLYGVVLTYLSTGTTSSLCSLFNAAVSYLKKLGGSEQIIGKIVEGQDRGLI
jgi:hypothetical protein